ncbi:MAG TPA: F0F1 ATP synthase subunit epsilon [Bacillota bacterium]|nr:F0F1 ATP synthase subunit epsilon [Bacillota bacterium]
MPIPEERHPVPSPKSEKLMLEVVTPTKIELAKEVDLVIAPTIKGRIGILPRHIRLMTILETGILEYKINGQQYFMAVSEGYLEVTPHKVIVLAEAADLPEHIDVEQALAEKRQAEADLNRPMDERISFARTQVSLQRAITKLQVVRKYGSKKD